MNTRYVLTLCTALVVGGALLIGSAHALDKADVTTPINDTWLTAKTKIALAADSRVKGRQIDVETTNNVVMLRGKVDSNAAKQAAEDITKMLDGVKTVKNDLEVVTPSTRESTNDKDDAITTRVKEHIAMDSQLKQADHDQCQCVLVHPAGPRCKVGEERSHGEGEGLRPREAPRSCRFERTESTQLHVTHSFTRRFRHEEAHRSVHVRHDSRCRSFIPLIRG
jgi:hypothetical protein